MSFSGLVPCITYAGNRPLFSPSGSGGGADWSTNEAISNVDVNGFNMSNINELDSVEILTGTLTSLNIVSANVDVLNINAVDLFCGNITVRNLTDTSGNIKILNEDNQQPNYLQAISGNLYFNNQLLAQAGDIDDIADWSLYPAVQTVNVANRGINNAGNISFDNNTNILSVNGSNELLYNDQIIYTGNDGNVARWSTYNAINNIQMSGFNIDNINESTNRLVNIISGNNAIVLSTGDVNALYVNGDQVLTTASPSSGVSSINTLNGNLTLLSTNTSTLTVNTDSGNNTISLSVPPSAVSAPVDWADYPANADVVIPYGKNLAMNNVGPFQPNLGFNTADINATLNVGNIQNAPFRPSFNAYVDNFNVGSIVSPAFGVNFNSLGGVNINSVVGVSIAGGGGVSISGIGGIALTGAGGITVLAGGILVSGGGLAVSAGGILVGGGGLAISAGGLSVNGGDINFPTGKLNMGDEDTVSGDTTIYGGRVIIKSVGTTNGALLTNFIGSNDFANSMVITGVASINGVAWPPPSGGSAVGPAGSIQYSNGTGGFQGNNGLLYNGTSRITNATATNFIDINETANGNSIAISSTNSQVNMSAFSSLGLASLDQINITAGGNLAVSINGSSGVAGQVLTSDGVETIWANPPRVISERATNTTPINITAVTFGTAQTILTMTITPTALSDINVNVSFHYQTNSNTQYNLIFYLTLDGVQIGTTTADTLGGANHFSNCAIVGSALNQSIGSHTILLKAYAGSAPASGNLTIIASSGFAIANLV
jgi:hypothetical protein